MAARNKNRSLRFQLQSEQFIFLIVIYTCQSLEFVINAVNIRYLLHSIHFCFPALFLKSLNPNPSGLRPIFNNSIYIHGIQSLPHYQGIEHIKADYFMNIDLFSQFIFSNIKIHVRLNHKGRILLSNKQIIALCIIKLNPVVRTEFMHTVVNIFQIFWFGDSNNHICPKCLNRFIIQNPFSINHSLFYIFIQYSNKIVFRAFLH